MTAGPAGHVKKVPPVCAREAKSGHLCLSVVPEDIYHVNQMQQLGRDHGAALPVNIIESFDAFMGEKQHSIVGINN